MERTKGGRQLGLSSEGAKKPDDSHQEYMRCSDSAGSKFLGKEEALVGVGVGEGGGGGVASLLGVVVLLATHRHDDQVAALLCLLYFVVEMGELPRRMLYR